MIGTIKRITHILRHGADPKFEEEEQEKMQELLDDIENIDTQRRSEDKERKWTP